MRRWVPLLWLLALQGCVPPSRQPSSSPAPAPSGEAPPPEAPPSVGENAPPAPLAEPPAEPLPEPHDEEAHADAPEDPEGEGDVDDHDEQNGVAARTTAKIDLTDEQIAQKARKDPGSLGSLSIGTPNVGYLVNGVQMPPGEGWQIIGGPNVWGTQETIDFLIRSIQAVNRQFPHSPRLFIGHISARYGGYLSPHKSHQAGRDVDLGFYYTTDARWFERVSARNLDLPRTWALLKALINETDVEMIFINTSVQHLLARHAAKSGEDEAFLDRVFQVRGKSPTPVIRHARGHDTHIHVRFHNPHAQELGRRAQAFFKRPATAAHNPVNGRSHGHGGHNPREPAVPGYVMHRARNGDILVNLAKHYNTTPEAIIQANNIRGNSLKIGHVYRIPVPPKTPPKTAPKGAPAPGGRSRG